MLIIISCFAGYHKKHIFDTTDNGRLKRNLKLYVIKVYYINIILNVTIIYIQLY